MTDLTKYQREVFPLIKWDPRVEYEEPDASFDGRAFNEIIKGYLRDTVKDEEFLKASGEKTLYQAVKSIPTGDWLRVLSGNLTYEDVFGSLSKEKVKIFGIESRPLVDMEKENGLYDSVEETRKAIMTILDNGRQLVVKTSIGELKELDETEVKDLDKALKESGNPEWNKIVELVDKAGRTVSESTAMTKALQATEKDLKKRLATLESEVSTLNVKLLSQKTVEETVVSEHEGYPDGKVVYRKASEVFPDVKVKVDLEVPSWEWDFPHPDVPKQNPNYLFRPNELMRVLYALVTNKRMYLHGHTGSGKTTLLEQVAAYLNWPFGRINFDSEITRMDLIGRDKLSYNEDGSTYSHFEDGILPRLMSGPYIACFDELDFCRPDVAYVMQAATEGNSLRITEDGDRVVKPHAMFRMFGTGNTVGQGDENGMYQGARPQSMAFLDRFTIWAHVEYLTPKDRERLITKEFPGLQEKDRKALLKYTTEHLDAFLNEQKIVLPFTPRGMLAVAEATLILGSLKDALIMTVLDRCNNDDRAVLKGIIDRVA